MARGRKKLSLDEQLVKVTTEIEKTEISLRELKEEKKNLEQKIDQERLIELDKIIKESGKSFEDVKRLLENNK